MALTRITTGIIADNTLAVANIADNAVDATKIASNSILTRHIDDDQITGDQLADNITIAGTLTSTGAITGTLATAAQTNITSLGTLTALTVDDITIDGSTISDGADLTLDVAASITLDSDSGVIDFDDGGTNIGRFENSSSDFKIESRVQDKDIVFVGNDNGTGVTALTLDMSDAGAATFNHHLIVDTDTLVVDASNDRVGVNTASPSSPLHVTRASSYPIATFTQNGADQYNVIYLQNSNSTASTVCFGTGGGSVGNASWANSAVFGTTADAKVVLLQNDSAAVTIDTDQKVGIGTASPAGVLTIHKEATGANDQELLTIRRDGGATSDGSRQASIAFFDGNNDTYTGKISGYRDSPAGNYDGGLRFYVNPHATNANGTFAELNNTPAMYLNPDRSMTTFGDIYVPSGNGINFGYTADGTTMSSELLDDYEEGTWTPTVGGWSNTTVKSTASQNQGHYTKVGHLVTVTANITWNGTETLSGGIIVRGLPYAAKNVAGYRAGGSIAGFTGLAASGSYTYFTLGIDASQVYFYIINANASGYGHSPTVSNSGAVYGLTFSYQTT